ncbi:MAG: hypothetical protein ABIG42_02685 [bacterium]
MADLNQLRKEIENFNREMNLENYLHFSGQKDKLEIASIYNKYSFLFTRDLALELQDSAGKYIQTGDENLNNIFGFVLFGWIGEKLKSQNEELANLQAKMKISFDGEEESYRNVPVKIMNTDNSEKRKGWYMGLVDADIELTEKFHKPMWEKIWEMTSDMGFRSYLDTCGQIHEVDYLSLSKIMNDFIAKTEELYVDVFDDYAKELAGKPLNECGYWDASYLLRGKSNDKVFSAENLIPVLRKFVSDFGFPLDDVPAIILDIEKRPKKVSRAFCAVVEIGKEVYINLQPVGGHKDYTTLLHEAGHAYHYAFANPDLKVDLSRLGDRAVSEGFAFLFNYLPENPQWCKRYLKADDVSDLVYSELRQKLFFMRRYGAKLAYEVELHKDNSLDGKAEIYKENLQNAVKFETVANNYLVDLDTGFYSADYLRAWIWEVQLRNYLMEKYGPMWFTDKRAGEEVCEMWKLGKKYPIEELARRIGYDGIDIEPLKNSLVNGLAR